jgi:hypothetical protein
VRPHSSFQGINQMKNPQFDEAEYAKQLDEWLEKQSLNWVKKQRELALKCTPSVKTSEGLQSLIRGTSLKNYIPDFLEDKS